MWLSHLINSSYKTWFFFSCQSNETVKLSICLFASIAFRQNIREAGTKVGPDQLGSLTSDWRKKMIRPREFTLGLISKLTLVKSAQTLNSFGLKKRFLFYPRWSELIQSDFCTCPYQRSQLNYIGFNIIGIGIGSCYYYNFWKREASTELEIQIWLKEGSFGDVTSDKNIASNTSTCLLIFIDRRWSSINMLKHSLQEMDWPSNERQICLWK